MLEFSFVIQFIVAYLINKCRCLILSKEISFTVIKFRIPHRLQVFEQRSDCYSKWFWLVHLKCIHLIDHFNNNIRKEHLKISIIYFTFGIMCHFGIHFNNVTTWLWHYIHQKAQALLRNWQQIASFMQQIAWGNWSIDMKSEYQNTHDNHNICMKTTTEKASVHSSLYSPECVALYAGLYLPWHTSMP